MNVLGTGPLGKVPFFPIEVEVADVGFGGDGGEVSKREELELGSSLYSHLGCSRLLGSGIVSDRGRFERTFSIVWQPE